MRQQLPSLFVIILLLTALLLSGGCTAQPAPSSNNTGDLMPQNNQPSTEDTPNDTPSSEQLTLKIGMAGQDIKTACIIIAQELGYYTEEGLTVEFETVSNLSEGLTAVDLGKLDILPFGVIPSATFVGQGADVVIFGGTISEGSEIVVLPENHGTLNSPEDFRGKRLGCYRMETGHMVVKGWLREAGLEINSEVEFVLLDSQQTIIEAVRKGEVDMGFLNSGQGYVAQQAGLVIEKPVGELVADFPCCRQTTSRATLENKREALVKFQIANLRAYETYLSDEEASIQALMHYSGQPAEYVRAVLFDLEGVYETPMIVSLDPNRNQVIAFYELMKANGDIDPATSYKMEDHIDVSVYGDALAELLERDPEKELYQILQRKFEQKNF